MADNLPQTLTEHLANLPLGRVRYFDKIGSTNEEALRLGRSGAPDFSLVIADQQTAGRGRLGRRWVTHPGSALAFSLVLHPTLAEMDYIGLFSPWGALAVSRALENLDLQPEIKWPNDVLLERMKIAGILLESTWIGEQIRNLVIGIGINVSPSAVPPPDQLHYPATSVEGVLSYPVDRWALLRQILTEMIAWRARLSSLDFLQAWEQRLAFKGEWVTVGMGNEPGRPGQVSGIESDGSLRLIDPQGNSFHANVGELSLRPGRG